MQERFLAEPATVGAFDRLTKRAAAAGFDLRVASAFRDYDRQTEIINQKWTGARPVKDVVGLPLLRENVSDLAWLEAILRFSALPGTSRHHWGTDLDIWDAAAVCVDYQPALEPSEYEQDGVFAEMTFWLDALISADDAEGFYKPYNTDYGGVAPEAWHISYRPVASALQKQQRVDLCWPLWRGEADPEGNRHEALAMLALLEPHADDLFTRFVLV
ncbi:M15 family metallopeptidase [Luminiphilus sp.]|nr:M15 family metallopeptidase [Luminiphilus sp.]MDB2687999.1 M15 family metallopeptidase [Luminiphilus sp.]MDC6473037.1 M15 family metallopeptidase [Luminiphilus sp.]